jgi:hypothetical protein
MVLHLLAEVRRLKVEAAYREERRDETDRAAG